MHDRSLSHTKVAFQMVASGLQAASHLGQQGIPLKPQCDFHDLPVELGRQ
jgi:hypothetical protein